MIYAGKLQSNSNYLSWSDFLTMSPHFYRTDTGLVFVIHIGYNNIWDHDSVAYLAGVRPVINLKNDVTFSQGDGSVANPWVINTN